jgi:hypothetical protein
LIIGVCRERDAAEGCEREPGGSRGKPVQGVLSQSKVESSLAPMKARPYGVATHSGQGALYLDRPMARGFEIPSAATIREKRAICHRSTTRASGRAGVARELPISCARAFSDYPIRCHFPFRTPFQLSINSTAPPLNCGANRRSA